MTRKQKTLAFGSAMLGLIACDQNKSSETQTTGATMPMRVQTPVAVAADPNDDTIDRITAARCTREVACNNIGTGKKWVDDSSCHREVRQNVHADFRRTECRYVLTDKLQSCIDAIRDEKCDAVLDLTRMNACRKSAICSDTP
jgi:hypothetical protein